MKKVYILLPVHNRSAVTEKFIDCLVAQTQSNYHLILIDDGSTDDTVQMVQAKIKNLTVLKGRGDWWWAGSLQQGINWLQKCEVENQSIVMFANDDITFSADFLQNAVSILDSLDTSILLPQVIDEETGIPQETGLEVNLQRLAFKPAISPDKINCLPTRGLFMRMADLRKIGGFYPKLLPHYWSDYEFTIRAHKKGLKLCTRPDIAIGVDHLQTGNRTFEANGLAVFLKQTFSKKSVFNPIYQTIFILLVCKLTNMPRNIYATWRKIIAYAFLKLKESINFRFQRLVKFWKNKIYTTEAVRRMRNNLKIIVGSEATKQDGWISTEYPVLDLTNARTFAKLFDPGSVSNFLAEHVWEHMSLADGTRACSNCFAYLKQGGLLRIAVPDGFHPDLDYIAQVKPGGYGPGANDHKVLYNYETLSDVLKKAGFKIKLLEWFDENGNFHSENWSVEEGFILRSTRFDPRNRDTPTAYTSLIIDAIKP